MPHQEPVLCVHESNSGSVYNNIDMMLFGICLNIVRTLFNFFYVKSSETKHFCIIGCVIPVFFLPQRCCIGSK